jgi:hypothetical protein
VLVAARLLLAGCALVAALLLSACGSSGSDASGATLASGAGRATSAKTPSQPKTQKKPHRPPAGNLCQSQIGGFIGSMDSLRRRLAVGVTYEQYVDEINGIRSTYRDVPAGKLQIDCAGPVGVPSEKAFNRYILAANQWGECISEAGCGSAEVEPVLQRQWRIASHFLSEAQQGLLQ